MSDTPALLPPVPDSNSETGGFRTVLAIIVLAIATFGTIGFMYIQFSDRVNGQDAWREKGVRDRMAGYKLACEKKFEKFGAVQEWIRDQKLKTLPPPELMVNDPCTQPESDSLNKPKE